MSPTIAARITRLVWEEGSRRFGDGDGGHSPACLEFLAALYEMPAPSVRGAIFLDVSPEAVRAFGEEVLMSSVNIWENEDYDTPQERRAATRDAGKLREWIKTYHNGISESVASTNVSAVGCTV